jgi:tRNA (guanine10-N2)-dimethyltransferase
VLDPFCGTGSSLIEATYIGCRAVGIDAQRRMVFGCRRNLRFFNISPEGLMLADARQLPLFRVDCVVTDPPYGRSASTLKSTTKQLVQEVLAASYALLGVGQRICIALPIMVNRVGKTEQLSEEISSLVQKLGYRLLESHRVYVHRSLTREVIVYQKE